MTTDPITQLAPENIRALKPYQPGRPIEEVERELGLSGVIKVASNENPMGPSPKAAAAAAEVIRGCHRYPDGGAFYLRQAVAERRGIEPEQLVFGAGCDEIIHMIVRAFCRPGVDEVLTHKYAFISYRLAAMAHGCKFIEAEVDGDLRCDLGALIASITDRTRVIFVASPNNPTGAHLSRSELERLVNSVPDHALLVIDEAYHEYAIADVSYTSSDGYRAQSPRIVTLRTFSKIYGLAGMRVGYAMADARVADLINRVRGPFNVNSVAQAAALAALDDTEHVERSRAAAITGIAALTGAVSEIGLRAYPSLANFVLVDVGRPSDHVYQDLLRQGVIVRPMTAWGLATHLRISVGTPAESERVAAALTAVLK